MYLKLWQIILHYSSLIGLFYQHGIGCEIDKAKAFEIYSNAINYEEKSKPTSD